MGRGADEVPIGDSWHDEGCDSASTGASNDSWHQSSDTEDECERYLCPQCRLMPLNDAKCTLPKCEECILEGEKQQRVEVEDIQSEEESPSDLPSEGDSEWECGGDCMHCNMSQDEFCFVCRLMLEWRRKPCAAQSNTPLRGRKATYRKRGTVKKRGVVKKRKAPTPAVAQTPAVVPKRGGGKREPQQRNFLVLGQ